MTWAASVTAMEAAWDAVATEVAASRTELGDNAFNITDYEGEDLGGVTHDMTAEVTRQIAKKVIADYRG